MAPSSKDVCPISQGREVSPKNLTRRAENSLSSGGSLLRGVGTQFHDTSPELKTVPASTQVSITQLPSFPVEKSQLHGSSCSLHKNCSRDMMNNFYEPSPRNSVSHSVMLIFFRLLISISKNNTLIQPGSAVRELVQNILIFNFLSL